jgi:O-antigen/teichoic acid export membrane protein
MASFRAIKFIGAYTVLGFVPLAVSFFLLPLYTTYLVPAEYGVLTLANVTQTFATLAVALGLDSAFGRFYFDFLDSREDTGRLLSTVINAIVLIAGILALALALVGPWLFEALWQGLPFHPFGWYALVGGLAQVIYGIVFLWYRNDENLRMALLVSLVTTACQTAGSILALTAFTPSALGAVAGRTIGMIAGMAPFTVLLLRQVPWALDIPLLRKLFAFGLPLLAYTVVAYVLFNGDRIVMQRWYPLKIVGLYGLAATLVLPLEIVLQSAQQALQPMFYRMLEHKDPTAVPKIGRFYVALGNLNTAGMVAVILLAEPLLQLLRGRDYLGATHFVAILAFAQLFRVQYTAYAFSLFYSKQSNSLPIVTAAALVVGLGVAWVACRFLGPLGVGVGVAGWKCFQALTTRWAMSREDTPQIDIGTSMRWALVAGAYTVAVYFTRARRPDLATVVSWGAGVALAAVSLFAAFRNARAAGVFHRSGPSEAAPA